MLLFELFLITFSLNVIQSELHESKPGESSEVASSVQETSISLNDLVKSNIKNNIVKRDVPDAGEQEDSMDKSARVQSKQLRHLAPRSSRARRLSQLRGHGRAGGRLRRFPRREIQGSGKESRKSPRRGSQDGIRGRSPGVGIRAPRRPLSRGRQGYKEIEEESPVGDEFEETPDSDGSLDYPDSPGDDAFNFNICDDYEDLDNGDDLGFDDGL
uniref:FoP_duplication domain-containing protein n=1 Tax=Strongyloides venezuelensis TaxID=75913 RepID=A0A0K0F3S8_STRVS